MEALFYILGGLVGYMVANLVCGDFAGDKPERSLRLLISDHYIHLHHWFYSLLILIGLIIFDMYHPFLYGALFGLIVQGLTYQDRFVFIYHKDEYEDIYAECNEE